MQKIPHYTTLIIALLPLILIPGAQAYCSTKNCFDLCLMQGTTYFTCLSYCCDINNENFLTIQSCHRECRQSCQNYTSGSKENYCYGSCLTKCTQEQKSKEDYELFKKKLSRDNEANLTCQVEKEELKIQLEVLKAQNSNQQNQFEGLQKQIDDLKLYIYTNATQDLQAQIDEIKQTLDSLNLTDSPSQEIQNLKQQIQTLEQITVLQQELNDLKTKVNVLNQQISLIKGYTKQFPITDINQFYHLQSGYYYYQIDPKLESIQVYFDLSREDQIWMRLNWKDDKTFKGTSDDFQWTIDMLNALKIENFGVSDDLNTIYREASWILKDFTYFSAKTINYKNLDYDSWNDAQVLANVLNGKTPSGTEWDDDYDEGWLYFQGIMSTFGDWKQTFCDWLIYSTIDSTQVFRTGGHPYNNGEFIHLDSCNYATFDNSISSRVQYSNTRVFWFKLEGVPKMTELLQ